MAVTKPVNVPKKNITSIDITGLAGGLSLNGEQNAKGNQIVEGQDVEISIDGYLTPRRSLTPWLPSTVEAGHEILPCTYDGELIHFTADDGKMKYCVDGASSWTDCGGDNTVTTMNGGKVALLRVLDSVLILNGGNGDKLAYVRLSDNEVVKYDLVDDPVGAPTLAATGITASGSYKIYYGYTYSSATGETKISPLLTQAISKPRDNWKNDGTEYVTVTRPGVAPAGATYWNLYVALASNGGTIQETDMLMLASGLDLATSSIVDNGTLAIDIGRGNPPSSNSTDGPKVEYGIETNGRPVLFGDVENKHSIYIGGDGEFALDFSSSNGGYRTEPSKGTNYYPASVVGFRNGQGIPSLTILFSNTQGLSKQATLEQQTINYGTQTFVVWGVTEQNYGAAGVASSSGVVNYRGQLTFPSTDGFTSMDTQPSLQNVIATKPIDTDIKPASKRIKVSALSEIVGTGWDNRLQWIVPANGFETPNEVWIRDLNNEGVWTPPLKIPAQWIGTVSPPDSPAFVYIRQGTETYKLFDTFGTVDYLSTGSEAFSTYARGALLGVSDAYNSYMAVVQAVFYVVGLIGDIRIGVNYRNQNGKLKTKSKLYRGPRYVRSSSGGWSDPQYVYHGFATPAGWDPTSNITTTPGVLERIDKRIPLSINDLASEVQWWIETEKGYNDYLLRAISFEGERLGVKPDLR